MNSKMGSKIHQPNEALRRQRQLRGWSQQRLGELVGTDHNTISIWENGRKKTSPFYQEKLCSVFGMTAEELEFLTPAIAPSLPDSPLLSTSPIDMLQLGQKQQVSKSMLTVSPADAQSVPVLMTPEPWVPSPLYGSSDFGIEREEEGMINIGAQLSDLFMLINEYGGVTIIK